MNAFLSLVPMSICRFSRHSFFKTCKVSGPAAILPALLALSSGWTSAYAATQTATTLAVTSGGSATTAVSAGSVVALTASVKAGGTPVTVGQVNFCDASATYCTDIHILGTAQLTSAGTAVYKFRPGIGSHRYKAVFAGTKTYGGSASGAGALTVTGAAGALASTTSIAESGSWGNYAVTATVTEFGGTAAPTGTVSFVDSSNGNAVLDAVALGPSVTGIAWPNPQSVTLPTNNIQAVAIGDFNGDGIPDLAVSGGGPDQPLSIFLGNADGTYTAAPTLTLSYYAYGFRPIAVADFNGDGKQDLTGLDGYSNTVTILLGNGDGTFTQTATSPTVGANSNQLAIADFNGDGIPDLAVTSALSNSLDILLGNGDGTFTLSPSSPTIGGSPMSIAAGDFNRDGSMDLAITDTYDDTVSVLLGNGDGTFAASTAFHCGISNSPIAAADFNGDGKLDLALGVSGIAGVGDTVTILAGNGDGTFASPSGQAVVPDFLASIQVGDFNGDGLPDLALTDSTSNTFTVFLANGSGSFTATSQSLPAGINPELVSAVGDLNGDGRTDLLIGGDGGNNAFVYLTEPTETATATATLSIAGVGQHLVNASYAGNSNYTSSASGSIALWGVTPATTTTLALTAGSAAATSVSPGTVVTFTATVAAGTTPVTTGQVNFCDASANSCTDIHLLGSVALTSSGKATFEYVPGPGTRSYKAEFAQNGFGASSSSSAVPLTVGPAPAPVYSNTTAITDSGSPGDYSLTATVIGLGGPAALTGTVSFLDTTFGNASLGTATLGSSSSSVGWLVAQTQTSSEKGAQLTSDFNGDGIPDLAVLTQAYNSGISYLPIAAVSIFFGKGDGTFTSGPTTQTSLITYLSDPSMVAGDFNGDGKPDLAIVSYTDASAGFSIAEVTLLGNGDGTFAASPSSTINQNALTGDEGYSIPIVSADFNGDGVMDIAVVNQNSNGQVVVALGKGDGTFVGQQPIAPPGSPFFLQIVTGDFNGDGIPDIAPGTGTDTTTILLGKGDGTFTPVTSPITFSGYSPVAADFNGDGILDLAFAGGNGVQIALGKGDGTFHEAAESTFAPSNSVTSLVAADLNQDGKVDLVGIDNLANQIVLLIGAGDGSFLQAPAITNPTLASVVNQSFAAGDFNGDGFPDLATSSLNPQGITALLTKPSQFASATVNNIAPVGAGTHNVEASYSGDSNYSASVSAATVALTAGLAPVTFSPASGTYTSVQTITLRESIPGATIYYSASGIVNTTGFVPYTAPIQLTVGGSEIIQAYATETGYQQSNYSYANYTLNLPLAPQPVISPGAGNYVGVQSVTITDSAPGATIYYTTNESLPTIYSSQYSGPIAVTTSETIVAIAVASGYSQSAPASAQYIIGSSPSSFIYTLAGNGADGYSGDGGPATLANLNGAASSVRDSSGNLYIADSNNNVIRKVTAGTGVITTFAGTGVSGYSGDNGAATSAQFNYPYGLFIDSVGNLYVADEGNSAIRKIAAVTGVITTVAGNGTPGLSGDGGLAINAQLSYPLGVAVDSLGNLYIADSDNFRIREVSASTGIITTVAGSGQFGYSGDGGPATAAAMEIPWGVAVDTAGNLYIADTYNDVVRKVTASTGVISAIAGSHPYPYGPYQGYSGDGGPATSALLFNPQAIAVDGSGNLFIVDTYNQVIREVTASNGIINTIAGAGPGQPCGGFAGDGGPALGAALCYPSGISIDSAGNLYIADSGARIRTVTAAALPPTAATAAPTIMVAAGTYASPQTVTITDATPGASIYITTNGTAPSTVASVLGYNGPIDVSGSTTIQAIAVAPGHLTSSPVSAAYTITSPPAKVIHTIAGSGIYGFSGGGGPATSAQTGYISALASDGADDLFFTDPNNNVVWEVAAATGNISIVAGNGSAGFSGDGGPATSAQLNYPNGIAVDTSGNLYIADSGNVLIREVVASTGLIQTIAGTLGQYGYPGNTGDGGPATSANLNNPQGLAFDSAGNLYIADSGDNEVRVISAATGIITSFAGNGGYGFSGEGGLATSASLYYPNTLAFDNAGNLYIGADAIGRVCKVTKGTGIFTTVAGNGNPYGSSGDGGPATSAEVYPLGLAVDAAGNLYIANGSASVREVAASNGIITKFAGNGYPGYSGDGGSATIAQLQVPQGIAFDASGNLYIADSSNFRIREVSTPAPTATPVISPASGTYTGVQAATITDASSGAVIYYTTDGTTPTNTSNVYSGSIAIAATTTLQAIAIAPGLGQSAVVAATYTIVLPVAPTVAATPSATSITTAQTLTVAVTVAGTSGSPTPTGSVTLSGGGYTAPTATLAKGSATFSLAAGVLAVGTDSLTASYTPDSASYTVYTSANGATPAITVTQAIGTAISTVTLTPSATTITNQQAVSVAVTVSGTSGQASPTGNVTLASGSYSAQQTLSGSGAATFSIPAGALGSGANTLTASYSGDMNYATASGTTAVTVAPVLVTAPNPASVAPGSSATATATFSAGSTYSGTMNLVCTLTASPTGAQSLPTCSLNPTSITIVSGGTASSVVTVNTTAASSNSALLSPGRHPWKALGGGGVLALALLLGVPSRRRKVFMLVALFGIVAAGMIGCGGGSGSTAPPPPTTPATTAGSYTFSVVGTDSSNAKITASTNVIVTVQ
jgi:sugar lactone lactonase YvrE